MLPFGLTLDQTLTLAGVVLLVAYWVLNRSRPDGAESPSIEGVSDDPPSEDNPATAVKAAVPVKELHKATAVKAAVPVKELHKATDECRHLADVFLRLDSPDDAKVMRVASARLWHREEADA